jgi:DNA-binding PadR family transcriptional regulator
MSDKEIEDTLDGLVKKGFIRYFVEDGETLVKITPEGEAAFRETLRINKNNNSKSNTELN